MAAIAEGRHAPVVADAVLAQTHEAAVKALGDRPFVAAIVANARLKAKIHE